MKTTERQYRRYLSMPDRRWTPEDIERIGDAIIRWMCTVTFTLCGAAFLAAYAAQYLAGK